MISLSCETLKKKKKDQTCGYQKWRMGGGGIGEGGKKVETSIYTMNKY